MAATARKKRAPRLYSNIDGLMDSFALNVDTFHGVTHKYLQEYLDEFGYRFS